MKTNNTKPRTVMYRIIKILFINLIPLITVQTTFAQQNKIDSLLSVLKTAKEDTNKVNTLNILSKKFTNTGDYEQAEKYADYAFTLAEKLIFQKGKGNAYNNIGTIYINQGNYP